MDPLPTLARADLPTLTTAQIQEVDRLMIEEYGILLMQMMENTGRNLTDLAQVLLGGELHGKRVTVLCGRGNNGGGGLVAARHLHNRGALVHVVTAHPIANYTGVSLHQYAALDRLPLVVTVADRETPPSLTPAELIIDAIIGYGLRGNPRGASRGMIEAANQHGAPILSLDTPSGLDTSTGEIFTTCIQATATMTLALPKTGLFASPAAVGELYLADISVPPQLYHRLGLQVNGIFKEGALVKIT